ncbi:hypothetical protein JOB18_010639 [Solea senegalensis]|uniref:Uncharacterized protein n=1 Tax=Solea senegalensis TaxID=28829 RepID=A0AAV6Q787_SOLSE|nr:hypothetical protein JOB18_010639 [Solea senegalensis]
MLLDCTSLQSWPPPSSLQQKNLDCRRQHIVHLAGTGADLVRLRQTEYKSILRIGIDITRGDGWHRGTFTARICLQKQTALPDPSSKYIRRQRCSNSLVIYCTLESDPMTGTKSIS